MKISKLIEALRKNQTWVADEVVYSPDDRIGSLERERDAAIARADRLEALLREAQSELLRVPYENMWTKRIDLCRRIDAELKGEQQ